jgi:Holliday junction DNA helicase RuvA
MITRISGRLESVVGNQCVVAVGAGDIAHEVLVPAYLSDVLLEQVGQRVTLWTLEFLESPNQGASFVPRLLGFGSVQERRFFELLTTVRGIGMRKALRALATDVGTVAAAIARRDARSLTDLPEIGKRMAETIIAELNGKVDAFVSESVREAAEGLPGENERTGGTRGAEEDAIEALIALGETRSEAEVLVGRAAARVRRSGGEATVERLLDAVFAGRG